MLFFLRALMRSRSVLSRSPRLQLERLEDRTVPSASVTSKIGVVRPSSSGVAVFSLDNNGNGQFDSGDSVFSFGLNSDKFLVGDWNGTGYDKIGVVRPQSNGTDVFSLDTNGNGTFDSGDSVFTFGLSSDLVLVGDWNGDGRAKIGVARFNANGTATVSLDTNGDGVFDAGDQVFNFGQAGDKFIVGDWNGDGKAKVGVVRNDGHGGAIVILDSNGNGQNDPNNAHFAFGNFNDNFVVGDWNGDGKSKVGVVRPAASGVASWSLDTNGDQQFDAGDQVFSFGLNTDTYLIGKWKAPAQTAAVLPNTTTPTATTTPGPTGDVASLQGLTVAQLQPVIQAAINDWAAAGLDAAHVKVLQNATILIGGLNGPIAQTTGTQITLDPAASGLGWYLDPTPATSEEYSVQTPTGAQATTGTAAAKGVDLETVLAHEMGHVLGLGHSTDPLDVMYASVGVAFRRLPRAQDVALVPALVNTGGTSSPQAVTPAHGSGCTCALCQLAAG